MADTYDTAADAEADRAQQRALLTALGGWDRALRRDECGGWHIAGKHGSIHTWGDGKSWVLYVRCRSARSWTSTKLRLAFCTVTQDGDDEGCLRLHRLPTVDEAAVIRDVLGIQKRREVSEAERERLRALAFKASPHCEASLDENIALAGLAGPCPRRNEGAENSLVRTPIRPDGPASAYNRPCARRRPSGGARSCAVESAMQLRS